MKSSLLLSFLAGLLLQTTLFSQSPNDHWDYRFGIPGTSYYQGVVAVDPRNGDVYAAGDEFTWAGGVAVHNIAKWTRATGKWAALGTGPETSQNGAYITCMAVNPKNGNLYVGGTFSIVGGVGAVNIAMWNGTTWSAVPGAASQVSPSSIAFDAGTGAMYVAGYVGTINSVAMHHVTKFDGTNWTAFGSGFDQSTSAIAVDGSNGNVYVAGMFNHAGGKPITGFARWNGTAWDSVGGSFWDAYGNPGQVSSIVVNNGNVYVCGGFTKIGTTTINHIAQWNGTSWSQVGPTDFSNALGARTLVVIGTDLYAGGAGYIYANGKASYVARWDGSQWNALGSGIAGYGSCQVTQLATYQGELIIAAPQMSRAGSTAAKNYAIWNPTQQTWRALGPMLGVDQYVSHMAVGNHGEIYMVGGFLAAGTHSSPGLAKWTGSTWESVSKGVTFGFAWGSARRIAVAANGDLYVGGYFLNGLNEDSTKSPDLNYIGKYSGGTWSPLGKGLSSENVNDIKISGSDVYVGGNFYLGVSNKITNIAKWNGTAWDSLGGSITGTVNSIAVAPGGEVYAGGGFSAAGKNSAIKYIAKWNGTAWSALGGGVNGQVNHLVFHGGKLYVSGSFSTAGGSPIKGLATWDGTAWDTVSSAVTSAQMVAFQGDTLFCAGAVKVADTTAYTAYFTNGTWTPLGNGLFNYNQTNYGGSTYPNCMVVSGGDVYMGGVFNVAGGRPSYNVARWNSGAILAGLREYARGASVPGQFELAQNYPNPFNPTTEIRFTLNSNGPVSLIVYDMLGREIATLVNEQMHAGSFSVPWNATGIASGMYFYRLSTREGMQTRRMNLIK